MQQTTISEPLPSLTQLFKALGIALLVAAVILITVVLPAEYGIDPTGIGKALGLTELNAANTEETETAALPATAVIETADAVQSFATVTKSESPFQSKQMTILLEPGKGMELKALMREDEQFVFNWQTDGGQLYVDMHGERPNAGDEFTSYWEEKQADSAYGGFTAPFDGSHGWYWRNRTKAPVTINLEISGFYEKIYKP